MRPQKLSSRQQEEVSKGYQNGMSTYDLANKYPVSRQTISKYLKKQGVNAGKKQKKHTLNEEAFSKITEKSAYWIGFIMADGSVSERDGSYKLTVALHPKDVRHLRKLKAFLSASQNVKYRTTQNKLAEFTLYSKKTIKDLEKYGVVPNKSKTANIKELKENRHFWRGMVDGDGYVTKKSFGLVGSKDNLKKFRNFCREVTQTNTNIHNCNGSFSFKLPQQQAKPIVKRLYRWHTISLDRKYNNAKDYYFDGKYYPQI